MAPQPAADEDEPQQQQCKAEADQETAIGRETRPDVDGARQEYTAPETGDQTAPHRRTRSKKTKVKPKVSSTWPCGRGR